MRKPILLSLCVSLSAYIVSACDSEHQSNTYEMACLASGGTFQNNTCSCNGTPCDREVICIDNGSKCSISKDEIKTEIKDEIKDEIKEEIRNEIQKEIEDGIDEEAAFKLACERSSGVIEDKKCKCTNEENSCNEGVICNQEGKCAFHIDNSNILMLACEINDAILDKTVCNSITNELQLHCYASKQLSDETKSECNQVTHESDLSCLTSGGKIVNSGCQCGSAICPEGIVCKNNECASSGFICLEGQYRCYNNPEDGKGVFQKCEPSKDGMKWTDDYPCENSCTNTNVFESRQEFTKADVKCGDCIDNFTVCEMDKDLIGTTKTCKNGQYTEETICPNHASCSNSEEGVLQCGECQNDTIQCASEHEYRVCKDGYWSEEPQICAGNAVCESDACQTGELEDCEGDEIKCSESNGKAYLKKCIDNKFAVEECPDSNHCTNDTQCGECRPEDAPVCENINTGSSVRACNINNYKWNLSYYNNSCKNDSEVGECTNGFYKYNYDSNHPPIIQRCTNGMWPIDEDTIQSKNWPGNSLNDSLFTHIISLDEDSVLLTSNYLRFLSLYSNQSTFSYYAPENDYIISSLKNYFKWNETNNESHLSCFDRYFYGYQGACPTLNEFIQYYYDNKDIIKSWFPCNENECSSVSFCIDAITTGALKTNIKPDSYILTLNDQNESMSMKIEKASNVCNSNRTAAKGECPSNAIDMTLYHTGSFINLESDLKSNLVFDESVDIDTQICRFGITRNIQCNKTLNDDGVFACIFDEINNGQRFDSNSLCIDFYDANYNHVAYTFKNINIQTKTKASFVENKPANSSMVYMMKCDSNLCNADWTDCLQL